MAKRGREAALKRAREKARLDKQEAKREKRLARQADTQTGGPPDEQALMEEFARLSQQHENDQVTTGHYLAEKHRIFVELGIESDD